MFLHKQRTLSAVTFLFLPLVLSLLCVYYIRLYLHVVRECLCGFSKILKRAHVVSDECNAFLVL